MTRIFGISRHRLTTDGQGVTTLVAFSGCPLKCNYCINSVCHSPASGTDYTPLSLYDKVKIDDLYFRSTYGGITFGGGEPAMQSAFIEEFRRICGTEWHITLESSLNVDTEHIERLIPIVDDYIIDIKDMNDDIYYKYTQQHNYLVIKNLRLLVEHGLSDKITVRIPLIKDYNNEADNDLSQRMLEEMGLKHFDRFVYVTDMVKTPTTKNNTAPSINRPQYLLGMPIPSNYKHNDNDNDLPF